MLFEAFEVNEIALVIILYYIPICQFQLKPVIKCSEKQI